METILLNEVQVLDEIRLTRNKLLNMKDHLDTLLRKKIRLESEISLLRKSIKAKEKSFALKIKGKINLESCGSLEVKFQDEEPIFSGTTTQEILQDLESLVKVSQEIDQLLEDYKEVL